MIGCAKYFDSNKTMSFEVSDKKLFKSYTKTWRKKNTSLMKIKFDSEPIYGDNDNYVKTRIKPYGDKVNKNFQGNEIQKENVSHKCLSLIMLISVIKIDKKCYPQTFLEECKYKIKNDKIENLINDDLSSSDNESNNESNDESNDE